MSAEEASPPAPPPAAEEKDGDEESVTSNDETVEDGEWTYKLTTNVRRYMVLTTKPCPVGVDGCKESTKWNGGVDHEDEAQHTAGRHKRHHKKEVVQKPKKITKEVRRHTHRHRDTFTHCRRVRRLSLASCGPTIDISCLEEMRAVPAVLHVLFAADSCDGGSPLRPPP